jgi:hypothetical protein
MSTNLTRRVVLARTPAAIAAAGSVALPAMASAPEGIDPVVPLWREYFALETEIHALNKRYDEIWDQQPEDVRHPKVQDAIAYTDIVPCGAAPAGLPLYVDDENDIDKLLGPIPADATGLDAWRSHLRRQLVEAKSASRAVQDQLGQMGEQMDVLNDRCCEVMTAIEKTSAVSPAGHAAKVLFTLANPDRDEPVSDYPHCALASLLADLLPSLPDDMARLASRFVGAREGDATIGETLFAGTVEV